MDVGYSHLSKIPKQEKATIGFIISLIGGILILVQGLLLIVSSFFIWHILENIMRNIKFLSGMVTILGLITLIFGLIIIFGAVLIYKPGNETVGSILVFVFYCKLFCWWRFHCRYSVGDYWGNSRFT